MANKTKFSLKKSGFKGKSMSKMKNLVSKASKDMFDTDTKSVGKYAKQNRSYKNTGYTRKGAAAPSQKQAYKLERLTQKQINKAHMSARQRFKLEKEALKNERMKINSKPEVIRAVGQAIAMDTAGPSAGYTASATTSNVAKLTNGGANVTTIGGPVNDSTSSDKDNSISYPDSDYEVR